MDSASPTTSSSTNKGGRPKDWNEARSRRLVRLYLNTKLPLDKILGLLEDGVWKPGKDAANKVKNQLLGNDPRWLRPKDEEDEVRRINALKNSGRVRCYSKSSTHPAVKHHPNGSPQSHPDDEIMDGTTLGHSSRPSFDDIDRAIANEAPGSAAGVHWSETAAPEAHAVDTFDTFNDCAMPGRQPTWSRWTGRRQGTTLTTSTEFSVATAVSEKLKGFGLPEKSTRRIRRLLKQFTLPIDTDPARSPNRLAELSGNSQQALHGSNPPFSCRAYPTTSKPAHPRHILPGDLLHLDPNAASSSGCSHQTRACWCQIVKEVQPIQQMWARLSNLEAVVAQDLVGRDLFCNTAFHLLAAKDGIQDSFIRLVSHATGHVKTTLNARNQAGQTLLHVLHPSWYHVNSRLNDLVTILNHNSFDFRATDVYGRTFLHVLRSKTNATTCLPQIHLDMSLLNRRDAFGDELLSREDRNAYDNLTASRAGSDSRGLLHSGLSPARSDVSSIHDGDARIEPHTQLLRVITKAIDTDRPSPRYEDVLGRNGLHCLAEVELDIEHTPTASNGAGRPRKRKQCESSDVEVPQTTHQSRRLEFLRGLFHAKVDVNHYDRQGQTPLMAFVLHGSDESKSEKEILESCIRMLYDHGANLEARNRDGETAAFLATRAGQHLALKILLDLGANPNVRNAEGLGLVDILDVHLTPGSDGLSVARNESCRAVLSGIAPSKAKEHPTFLDEWGRRNGVA
ncbi:ankyrin [Xylariomycetidae sp. FL0641]|nr:ankyrin [Xylariomycetidae sp. FL0641]